MTHNRFLYQGQWLALYEIADRAGINRGTLEYRVKRQGMSLHDAIAKPITPRHLLNKEGHPARRYEFRGQMLTVSEIVQLSGMSRDKVYRRRIGNRVLDRNERADQLAEFPANARPITFKGITDTVAGWARRTGLNKATIAGRLKAGWPIRYALTTPTHAGGFDRITHAGRTMPIGEWAKQLGISPYTLRARLNKYGWDVQRAFAQPARKTTARTYTFDGKTLTLPQWAAKTGICLATLRDRIYQFRWPLERALTEPVSKHRRRTEGGTPQVTTAGGYQTTSQGTQGTGGGRREFHLHGRFEP